MLNICSMICFLSLFTQKNKFYLMSKCKWVCIYSLRRMSFEIKFQHFENIFVTCYTGRYIVCKIINNSVYFKNIGWQFLNFFEISLCELFNWQFLALNNISKSCVNFRQTNQSCSLSKISKSNKSNALENGKVVYGWLYTKLIS